MENMVLPRVSNLYEHDVAKGSLTLIHVRKDVVLGAIDIPNLIVNVGKALIASVLIAAGTAPDTIKIGTGTTSPAPGDTALQNATHSNVATRSVVTTTVPNDTAQYEHLFSFAGSFSITEAGLFSSTTLVCRQVFTAIPVISGDTLLVRWKLQA